MIRKRFLVSQTEVYSTDEEINIDIFSSEEAKICLNCPYPSCKKPNLCKHYLEEMKKLKEKKNANL